MPHSSRQRAGFETEFAIITALDEEYSAVRRALQGEIVTSISDIPFKHSVCGLQLRDGTVYGDILQPQDTGRVEAAILAGYILSRKKYKYILLVGIAGGFAGAKSRYNNHPLSLGDIIFASEIIDSEFQKITDLGPVSRDRKVSLTSGEISGYLDYSRSQYFERLSLTNGFHDGRKFHIHIGTVISGSKVIASSKTHKELLGRFGGVSVPLAVEMEGIAVAVARFRLNPSAGFAMIRGISDLADENKGIDEVNWRKIACQHAAETAVDYIQYIAKREGWGSRSKVKRNESGGF